MVKLFDAITSACAEVTKAIKIYIDTVALVEKDPTVPAWAKKENKPSYSIGEISGLSGVLEGLQEGKANAADFTTGIEMDTGHKWLDGQPIYAICGAGVIDTSSGVGSAILTPPGGVDTWLGVIGSVGGHTVNEYQDESNYARVSRSDLVGDIILRSTWSGAYNTIVFYTKGEGVSDEGGNDLGGTDG